MPIATEWSAPSRSPARRAIRSGPAAASIAQKANTANAFGLDSSSSNAGSGRPKGLAPYRPRISIAPFNRAEPLYGTRVRNPVDTAVALAVRLPTTAPRPTRWSAPSRQHRRRIGVVRRPGRRWWAVGVSGDTSCANAPPGAPATASSWMIFGAASPGDPLRPD